MDLASPFERYLCDDIGSEIFKTDVYLPKWAVYLYYLKQRNAKY